MSSALGYRARRSLANATLRALRSPAQLAALLLMLLYSAINLGVVVGMVVLPLPEALRDLVAAQIPGGVVARLEGVRGTLAIVLISLAASAAFENPLLQFGQADVDLLFPTPVPAWRLMLGRLLLNHLRALAAGVFLWGLAVVPLLRISGLEVWPAGAAALVALTCAFAAIDQLFAAALLWLARRDADRWLGRAGLLALLAAAGLLLAAGASRLLAGDWGAVGAAVGAAGVVLSALLAPIGLPVDVLLLPAHPERGWAVQVALLVLLDLVSAGLVLSLSRRGLRELAFTARGQRGLLRRALQRSGGSPRRFAQLAWSPELLAEERDLPEARVAPFGRGAWALVWVRLTAMRRSLGRSLLALGVLGAAPLTVVVVNGADSLGSRVSALIFSISLATQVFNELREHIASADADLALPVRRDRLIAAALLAHLPLYWAGGLVLLGGVALLQPQASRAELLLLALWQPLVALALLALRGAVAFLLPSAALPGRRDPLQYALVALLNAVVTGGLLMLALLPVWVLAGLSQVTRVQPAQIWLVLFGCALLLAGLGWLTLRWAYRRFEPSE